jgi:hypothetical protein
MRPSGGLKLSLAGAGRDDRRVRFAALSIVPVGGQDELQLVTDSRGRLRCHLPAGEYGLRLQDGADARFVVGDQRWTSVRLQLPDA